MLFLSPQDPFPPVELADKSGCLAYSMNLSITRLIEAYSQGIFPWYNQGEPVIWWSPDPRMVLFPKELKVSKSMKKVLKDKTFRITYNQDFPQVIKNCRNTPRSGQDGTWITDEIVEYYQHLFNLGFVQSVEVWNQQNHLVGGLYGVKMNQVFCGESMFATQSNASKAGFITFVQDFQDEFKLIDCQIYTDHLASLGAKLIPRKEFISFLNH